MKKIALLSLIKKDSFINYSFVNSLATRVLPFSEAFIVSEQNRNFFQRIFKAKKKYY